MSREIKIDYLKVTYSGDEAGMKAVMAGLGALLGQMVQQAEQPAPPKKPSKVVTARQPSRITRAKPKQAED